MPPRDDRPSTEVCHGICRSCSRQRLLWLPARICERCIEAAMGSAQSNMEAAVLAALEEMEEAASGS